MCSRMSPWIAVALASVVAFAVAGAYLFSMRSRRKVANARRVVLRGVLIHGAFAGVPTVLVGAVLVQVLAPLVAAPAACVAGLVFWWKLTRPSAMRPIRELDRAMALLDEAGPDKTAAFVAIQAALQELATQPALADQFPFLCMASATLLHQVGVSGAALTVLRMLDGRTLEPEDEQKRSFSACVYAYYAGDFEAARAALNAVPNGAAGAHGEDLRILDAQLLVREYRAEDALARVEQLTSPLARSAAAHAYAALGDDTKANELLDALGSDLREVLMPEGPATALAQRRGERSAYRG
jgi:hypothetical protein